MVHHYVALRRVSQSGHRGGPSLLDRLLQLDVEPADLRLLQPGLSGSIPKYTGLHVLRVVAPGDIPAGHQRAEGQPKVRLPSKKRLLGKLSAVDDANRPTQ